MVYSTRRFVVCLTMCHFVLVFFSPFSIAITSLGEERANLNAFRTFVRFVLVWICRFPLPLDVWEGLRFVIVAFPGLFSYFFVLKWWHSINVELTLFHCGVPAGSALKHLYSKINDMNKHIWINYGRSMSPHWKWNMTNWCGFCCQYRLWQAALALPMVYLAPRQK